MFGKGIHKQGMPFEDAVVGKLPEGARLPAGFKTFDAYVERDMHAISVKTLDTLTPSRLANPENVYRTIKRHVDKEFAFPGSGLSGRVLRTDMIRKKTIELGIPYETPNAQMQQISRAVAYAQEQGVSLNVTLVK